MLGSILIGELSAHLTQQSHSTWGNTVTLGNESSNRVTTHKFIGAEILGRLSCETTAAKRLAGFFRLGAVRGKNFRLPWNDKVSL